MEFLDFPDSPNPIPENIMTVLNTGGKRITSNQYSVIEWKCIS